MRNYDGMDPDQYRQDLIDQGADPKDADAAVKDLRDGQGR